MLRRPILLVAGVTLLTVGFLVLLGWIGFRRFLAELPPAPRTALGPDTVAPALTERVVVLLIDSLREDLANDAELMPHFGGLVAKGTSGVHITPPMTLTTMSVVSLGTGMTPSVSWSLKNFDAEPIEDETVFELLARNGKRIALLGDASWTQLYGRFAAHTLAFGDHGFFSGEEAGTGMLGIDQQTLDDGEKLLMDPSWDVVVLHVVGTDKMAHKRGAARRNPDGSPSDYARVATAIDQRLGQLVERVGGVKRTTWLVLSDHGCNLQGNHGGGEPEARRAPFVWAGAGIKARSGVEAPLTSVAGTLAALFGLRPPRTAEAPAELRTLEHGRDARVALRNAHLQAREAYVGAVVGVTAAPDAPPPARGLRARLEQLTEHASLALSHDGWLLPLGLAVGFLGVGLLTWLVLSVGGVPRPGAHAVVWLALLAALLHWSGWQFEAVRLLGEFTLSARGAAVRLAIIGVLLGAVALLARFNRLGVAWLALLVVGLTVGQSVMRWPYGPLEVMYRTVLVTALAVVAWTQTARALLLLVGLLAGTLLLDWVAPPDLGVLMKAPTPWLAGLAVGAMTCALAMQAVRTEPGALGRFVALGALIGVAALYQRTQTAWLVKPLLVALPLALWGVSRAAPLVGRNAVLLVALALVRALASDPRTVAFVALIALCVVASGLRGRLVAVGVGLALVAQHAFFFEVGYAFSFSTIDASVAFAATRDTINLGEGFAFLLCQHLGPWLAVVAALTYSLRVSADARGWLAGVLALVLVLATECVGAFASFEAARHNHWFTMHAVPLYVFAMCNVGLAGLAAVVCGRAMGHGAFPSAVRS